MLRINQVKIKIGHTQEQLHRKTAELLHIAVQELLEIKIIRQSIDARRKPEIFYSYSLDVKVKNEAKILHTQTSHIKNGICSLKNQYFSSQNSAQAAAEPHSNAFCMYFGSR